ncbi:glycine cleavage T C-terminal barrel domain-containing protein [Aquisediminimonas profunda]|uniref:glycine cleavage T C-terminal barrel domain-containing protein n=1 Tax=Aquisediminimonas profunda TaxID=1550733 RepID=UPI001C62D194|nr:glycine cleavage T C-terminal barrel domain-containing protein [Aquisediminimonas profunda]
MKSMIERHREGYAKHTENASGRYDIDRPGMFSPAAAAQDPANGKSLFFRWTPILIPYEYTDWTEEAGAHVATCYIGDWTGIAKIRVSGPKALAFLSYLGMNNLEKFALGQIKHHVQLDDRGHVASEGVVYRTGAEEFIYTGGGGDWAIWQASLGSWDTQIENISPDLFIFEIQGPKSLFALEAATGESLRDIRFNHSRSSQIRDIPVHVLRTGISGELGYELHGSVNDANAIWSTVVEAGKPFGIRQLGVRSQLVAHIEAGIATTGIDYFPASIVTPGAPKLIPSGTPGGSFIPNNVTDYFRFPGELGWGNRASKTDHDFIGRDALMAQAREGGTARNLVGLIWNERDILDLFATPFGSGPLPDQMNMPRNVGADFDQILVGGRAVGVSSSRTYSVALRKMISLAVLEKDWIAPGTQVSVLWGRPGTPQREIRAKVAALPFKEDRRRTDVSQL